MLRKSGLVWLAVVYAAMCVDGLAAPTQDKTGAPNAAVLSQAQADLATAESEFASAGLREGVQKSFLAHFAPDAQVFSPFAVPAVDWYRNHPDQPGKLIWAPEYIAVSATADLGLSSGPWRYEAERDGKTTTAYGHFFSIWRRNDKGHWEVLFDNGVSHSSELTATEATAPVPLTLPAAHRLDPAALAQRRAALEAADTALREALARNAPEDAYKTAVAGNVLWLREGSTPVRGLALPSSVSKTPPQSGLGSGPRVSLGLAASGDLGYTLGGSENERNKGVDARVWQYRSAGGWKLLADFTGTVDTP